jgi:hypothetical protein
MVRCSFLRFEESECELICRPNPYIYREISDKLYRVLYCECIHNSTQEIICDRKQLHEGYVFLMFFGTLIGIGLLITCFVAIREKIVNLNSPQYDVNESVV